jgi:MFS transporter, DHA2 family, multidrug resistance protein
MASGTADLQRDLGGAIMQSILGALLTAGYASTFNSAIAASSDSADASDQVQGELTKSFASADQVAQQYPKYADQIVAAARQSFLDGDDWAHTAGLIAIVLGALLVFFMFPRFEAEKEMLARFRDEDSRSGTQESTGRRD